MYSTDEALEKKVRDIIAVIADDLDVVTFEVEDGVAYIEGVVPDDEQRRAISQAVGQLDGLTHVVTCLATERVLPSPHEYKPPCPAPVFMHYLSTS